MDRNSVPGAKGQKHSSPLSDDRGLEWKRVQHRFDPEIARAIKALCDYNPWQPTWGVLANFAWIGAAIFTGHLSWWLYPLAVLIIGARQRGMSNLLHEGSHWTLFGRKTAARRCLNIWFATALSGWLILQTYYRYQDSHSDHHLHLGAADDPDQKGYADQGLLHPDAREAFLRRFLLPTLLGLGIPSYLWFVIRNRLVPTGWSKMRSVERREYLAFLGFWIGALALLWKAHLLLAFMLYWIVPFVTAYPILGRIIEVSEHYPLVADYDVDLLMTRNRLGASWEQLLTGTFGDHLHLVHHLAPGVPYWNLQKAHKILLQDPEYAALASRSSGLFTPSAAGSPSILAQLISGKRC